MPFAPFLLWASHTLGAVAKMKREIMELLLGSSLAGCAHGLTFIGQGGPDGSFFSYENRTVPKPTSFL